MAKEGEGAVGGSGLLVAPAAFWVAGRGCCCRAAEPDKVGPAATPSSKRPASVRAPALPPGSPKEQHGRRRRTPSGSQQVKKDIRPGAGGGAAGGKDAPGRFCLQAQQP